MEQINLFAIFMTGLIAGGLSCLAVQGGLLATTIAQRESSVAKAMADKERDLKTKLIKNNIALPILFFLITKLIAYTLFGFLLGWFGSFFTLNVKLQSVMQIVVAIFMLGTAFNLLNIHPIFRYFIIQPPKFLTRLVRKQSKSADVFAPALLGAFTVFIPCGTTQAMMALAIGSASPFMGALVLFSFVLGTSPVFFLLGYFTTKLGDVFKERFMKVAAISLILLAFYTFNNALALSGSTFTFQNLFQTTTPQTSAASTLSNELTIEIVPQGYNPEILSVKSGSKVKLHIVNKDGLGCQQAFTIPFLSYQKILRPGQEDTIEFDAPKLSGKIAFMCSMGMYRGVINVI